MMVLMMTMMILENDGDDVDDVSWWSDGAEWSGVHLLQRQKAAGPGLGNHQKYYKVLQSIIKYFHCSGLGNHQARSRPQSHC